MISSKRMCGGNFPQEEIKNGVYFESPNLQQILHHSFGTWMLWNIWMYQKYYKGKLSAVSLYLLIKWGWWPSDDYLLNGTGRFYQTSSNMIASPSHWNHLILIFSRNWDALCNWHIHVTCWGSGPPLAPPPPPNKAFAKSLHALQWMECQNWGSKNNRSQELRETKERENSDGKAFFYG